MNTLVTAYMAYMAREHEADCMHSLALPPSAAVRRDGTLEPLDETIAEVQSFVVQSRQLSALGHLDLVLAMTDTLRGLIDQPSPDRAIALAGFALRLREEHLL